MEYDVFISYSRRDSKQAEQICKVLSQAGLTYFIDRVGISAGASFTEVVSKAIDQSKVFLFLASSSAYKSRFTISEVFYAFKHKTAGSVIPYLLDDAQMPSELEFLLGTTNWLEIKDCPIGPDLVKAIVNVLDIDYSGNASKTTKAKTPWKPLILSLFFVAIIGLGIFAYWRFVRPVKTSSESELQYDLKCFNECLSEASSLSDEVYQLRRRFDTFETTDQETDALKEALAKVARADSIRTKYSGGDYENLFVINNQSLRLQERLDSMFAVWSGYAIESYELYLDTQLVNEANNALACINHALYIKPDAELVSIKNELMK